LNVWKQENTYLCLSAEKTSGLNQGSISLKQQSSRRRRGIDQRKASAGISFTRTKRSSGKNPDANKWTVPVAASRFLGWSEATLRAIQDIAHQHVKKLITGFPEKPMNMPLHIAHVRAIPRKSDVWDITVPDGHWFSLANGAVVHNSDAFGLIAIAKPLFTEAPDEYEYDDAQPDMHTGY
jgi:hypothetical protein